MNLIGKKFGKLSVISKIGSNEKKNIVWKCECECGSLTTATTYNLRSKHKRSCGCIRTGKVPENLVGRIFGRLLVKKYNKTDKWRTTHWDCQCRCGNITTVSRSALLNGLTKSCGCLSKEKSTENLFTWRKTQRKFTKKELAYNKYLYTIFMKYGITKEEHCSMLENQNHSCAICYSKNKLVIDHDHATGNVRGLLCNHCNRGLGSFKDEITLLLQAAKYLEKNNANDRGKNS